MKKHAAHIALVAGLAASAALYAMAPQLDDYAVNILVLAGINIILAVSLNLVNGHTGQFSLGHAGFMAAGAYTSSIITLSLAPVLAKAPEWQSQAAFLAALLAGGVFAAFCGFLVAPPPRSWQKSPSRPM